MAEDIKQKIQNLMSTCKFLKEEKESYARKLSEKEQEYNILREKYEQLLKEKKEDKAFELDSNKNNDARFSISTSININKVITLEKEKLEETLRNNKEENSQQSITQINLFKKLKEDINLKNNQIIDLMKENDKLKIEMEKIKANLIENNKLVLSKVLNNLDSEFIKMSRENVNLKSDKKQLENKIADQLKTIENNEISEKYKRFYLEHVNEKTNVDSFNIKLKNIMSVIKIYSDFSNRLLTENRRYKFLEQKNLHDIEIFSNDKVILIDKIAELDSSIVNKDIQIKGNRCEIDHLKKNVSELKKEIESIRGSKNTYIITYYYLGISNEGKIIFDRKDNQYNIFLDTKFLNSKLNLFEENIKKVDNNSFILQNNTYYSKEIDEIITCFNEFKKKYIENNKYVTKGDVLVKEKSDKEKKELKSKEKNLLDMFDF